METFLEHNSKFKLKGQSVSESRGKKSVDHTALQNKSNTNSMLEKLREKRKKNGQSKRSE